MDERTLDDNPSGKLSADAGLVLAEFEFVPSTSLASLAMSTDAGSDAGGPPKFDVDPVALPLPVPPPVDS